MNAILSPKDLPSLRLLAARQRDRRDVIVRRDLANQHAHLFMTSDPKDPKAAAEYRREAASLTANLRGLGPGSRRLRRAAERALAKAEKRAARTA